jgi:nucleotide-binding universal stress UspA family protein
MTQLPGLSFATILVPTDFSEDARHALEYGELLARQLGAQLHLLHVVEMPIFVPPYAVPALSTSGLEALVSKARSELEQLVATIQGIDIITTTRIGSPADQIVEYATEASCDVIIIATHGRRGLAHFLLGSTTERVVRVAPCPVLSIRHPKRLLAIQSTINAKSTAQPPPSPSSAQPAVVPPDPAARREP